MPHWGELFDRKGLSDNTWGWAYRSSLDWQYQLRHWQNRQWVELNEELVVLRLNRHAYCECAYSQNACGGLVCADDPCS
ncbi:hypothetical protein AB6G21_11275 [Providencia hangzhouensis]|uniref:hypothetical protein n=1 Tax=Providencia hangzhouensis TaxID=3031799 RepID=UPI0034DD9684